MLVALVAVSHHRVQGVHRLVGDTEGCSAQRQVEQGRDDAVAGVFGNGFDGGLGHTFLMRNRIIAGLSLGVGAPSSMWML